MLRGRTTVCSVPLNVRRRTRMEDMSKVFHVHGKGRRRCVDWLNKIPSDASVCTDVVTKHTHMNKSNFPGHRVRKPTLMEWRVRKIRDMPFQFLRARHFLCVKCTEDCQQQWKAIEMDIWILSAFHCHEWMLLSLCWVLANGKGRKTYARQKEYCVRMFFVVC